MIPAIDKRATRRLPGLGEFKGELVAPDTSSSCSTTMVDQAPRRSERLRPGSSTPTAGPSRQQRPIRRDATQNNAPSTSTTSQVPEDVGDDDLCPICHTLLHSPVTTTCNHTMCFICMAHWAEISLSSQMTIVDVDEEPVPFNPVSDLEAKCPMCRTQTVAAPDVGRAEALKGKYPRVWAERETEEGEGDGEMGGVQTFTVYVGNRHKIVESEDANSHEWAFFVKPSRTDILEEVQLVLVSFLTRFPSGSFMLTEFFIASNFPPQSHYPPATALRDPSSRLGHLHAHSVRDSESWVFMGLQRCARLS